MGFILFIKQKFFQPTFFSIIDEVDTHNIPPEFEIDEFMNGTLKFNSAPRSTRSCARSPEKIVNLSSVNVSPFFQYFWNGKDSYFKFEINSLAAPPRRWFFFKVFLPLFEDFFLFCLFVCNLRFSPL